MLTDIGIKKLALPDKRREVPDGKVSGLLPLNLCSHRERSLGRCSTA